MSKTFICYRKKPDISCDGAKFIYDLIENGDLKSKFSTALCEDLDHVHERFDRPGYEKHISEADFFIISICEGFFDDLIEKYQKFNENRSRILGSCSEQEASKQMDLLKRQFFNDANIAYQEIACALAKTKKIYPFLVFESEDKLKDHDDHKMAFFMDNEHYEMAKYAVKDLLSEYGVDNPDLVGEIFHQTNVPKIVLEKGKEAEPCTYGKEMLINNFLGERIKRPYDKSALFSALKEHIEFIDDTIFAHANMLKCINNEPDAAAYYDLELDQDDHYFCITNAFINGVNYLREKYGADELGVGRGFSEVKDACGAFPSEDENRRNDEYCYWPVEMSERRELNPKEIHICAICFGAIILNNALKTETQEERRKNYRKCINGAMNLLLTLRNYKDASWIHSWNFGEKDDVKSKEGTVNQTTLSISTLLTCGFLDCQNEEQLKKRFLYLYRSIRWLDEKGKGTGDNVRAWRLIDNQVKTNLSLTLFSLDVYDKYHEKLSDSSIKDDSAIADIKNVIEKSIIAILRGFSIERHLLDAPTNLRDVLKLSKLLKSLCGSYNTINSIKGTTEEDRAIINWALDAGKQALTWLSKVDLNWFDDIKSDDIMESFPFNNKNKDGETEKDDYENCLELLFVDAVFVAVKTLEGMPEVKKAAVDKAYHVLWTYICKYVKAESESYLSIKGRKTENPPIYAYYYYQMVINDFNNLPEEYKNEND